MARLTRATVLTFGVLSSLISVGCMPTGDLGSNNPPVEGDAGSDVVDAAPTDDPSRDGGGSGNDLSVTVFSAERYENGTHDYMFAATLWGSTNTCPKRTVGDCTISSCKPASGGVPAHAGVLTLSSGASSFDLSPQADSSYGIVRLLQGKPISGLTLDTHFPLSPGDALSVVGAGGDLAAFKVTGKIPTPLTVLQPTGWVESTYPLMQGVQPSLVLDTAKDFAVSWVPSNDLVRVLLVQGEQPKTQTQVVCDVSGASGAFSVPTAALTDFVKTPDLGVINVQALNRTETTVSSRRLVMTAIAMSGSYGFTLK